MFQSPSAAYVDEAAGPQSLGRPQRNAPQNGIWPLPTSTSTSSRTPNEATVEAVPPSSNSVIRSQTDSALRKHKRHWFIGLLKEIPPPQAIKEVWVSKFRDEVLESLCAAVRGLNLLDSKIVIEVELYMAGKAAAPFSIFASPLRDLPPNPVVLEPTIWIFCTSRRCKKKVKTVITALPRLKHFMDQHQVKGPQVSLGNAPWPAASPTSSTGDPASREEPGIVSVLVEKPREGFVPGLRVRFLMTAKNGDTVERISTLGGLIMIGEQSCGLTTAHAVMDLFDGSPSQGESMSSDSESDSDNSSSMRMELDSDKSNRPTSPLLSPIPLSTDIEWVEVETPKVLAYMGKGTSAGDYSFRQTSPETSDFCLIDISGLDLALNEVRYDHSLTVPVSRMLEDASISEGPVSIVHAAGCPPLQGHLLDGTSSMIVRGTIMRTRKIQLEAPGNQGISGSWVIRDGALCGIIYAAYDQNPYLHMISAEDMMRNICKFTMADEIKLPPTSPEYYVSLLIQASSQGQEETVRTLIERGVDVNTSTDPLVTPLYVAAISGELETVKILLRKGADIMLQEGSPSITLQAAKEAGHQDVVDLLQDAEQLRAVAGRASRYLHGAEWRRAGKELETAVKLCLRVLGPDHHDTLTNKVNLGATYVYQRRWGKSVDFHLQEIETLRAVLGMGHLDTLGSMANLVTTYLHQEQWDDADKLNTEVLEKRKDILGEKHPQTLDSMVSLAFILRAKGRFPEALRLMERCVAGFSKALEATPPRTEHPHTALHSAILRRWQSADQSSSRRGYPHIQSPGYGAPSLGSFFHPGHYVPTLSSRMAVASDRDSAYQSDSSYTMPSYTPSITAYAQPQPSMAYQPAAASAPAPQGYMDPRYQMDSSRARQEERARRRG